MPTATPTGEPDEDQSDMSDLKVSAMVLPIIVRTAQQMGVDIHAILRRQGIAVELDQITRSTIALADIHAIVMAIEESSGDPAFGLRNGENFDFDFLPPLRIFLMSASSLREVFDGAHALQKLVSPALLFESIEQGDDLVIKLRIDPSLPAEDDRRYTEMVFSCLRTFMSRLTHQAVTPSAVHFRHGRGEIAPLYEEFFGCAVTLNAAQNVIVFNRAIIDVPLPGRFPELRRQASLLLDQLVANSPFASSLAGELRKLLAEREDMLHASGAALARALNMSIRTLQRRLAETGHGINDLRDQLRYQMAAHELKSGDSSIEEISEKLGFSDRHSFSRAFKRWSGVSPSEYREGRA